MATGILGNAELTAGVDTSLYVVPEATFSVITVNLCNRGSASVFCNIAISDTASPTTAEYLEFNVELLPSGSIERTGIVVNAEKQIIIRADAANVTAIVYGIETTTL